MAQYFCETCRLYFRDKYQLFKHLNDAHTKAPLLRYWVKERKYVCCGRLFKSITRLLDHFSREHNTHITYVKGMLKKRVYLNGVAREQG